MYLRHSGTAHPQLVVERLHKGIPSFAALGSAVALPSIRQPLVAGLQLTLLVLFATYQLCTTWLSRPPGTTHGITQSKVTPSFLKICVAAAVTSGMGSLGLCLLLTAHQWDTIEKVPIFELVSLVVQGVWWIVLAITVKLRIRSLSLHYFIRTWWMITFFTGTFDSGFSIVDLWNGRGIMISRIWTTLLWLPSSLYLSLSVRIRLTLVEDDENRCLEEPLSTEKEASAVEVSENITPYASAGIFSRACFLWLNSILKEGYKRPLRQDDIPNLGKSDTCAVAVTKFVCEWTGQRVNGLGKKPTLQSVLLAVYWKELAGTGFFAGLKVVMALAGPVLLNLFIKTMSGVRYFPFQGNCIVLALFVSKLTESLAQRQWNFGSRRLGMNLRSALIGALFQKVLVLSSVAKLKHSPGEVVNYMEVDSYRIGQSPEWLHTLWTTPFQITIALLILAFTVKWATIAGFVVILVMMLVNIPLSKAESRSVSRQMAAQDNRVRATSEALRNMKILKLQAWEVRFQEEVGKLRTEEVRWLKASQLHRAFQSFLFWMTPVLVVVATFTACLFLAIPLDASTVFTALATLRIIQEPIRSFPEVLAAVIQASVAMARISSFLSEEDLQADAVDRSLCRRGDVAVSMKDVVATWDSDSAKTSLKGFSVSINVGQHVAVCGTVGSGKSTFLSAILGELTRLSGEVKVSGSVAYVAQTAWIQSGTIRDNILFGKPMEKTRYNEAIKACALDSDIQSFAFGDLTEIGERGLNLSGGQKQRIQLARAVYQDADIYLLDDPFSAVDAHTSASIFKMCIKGCLLNKTVIMVTHQVELLPAVDLILVLKGGELLQSGSYSEMAGPGSPFSKLMSNNEEILRLHVDDIDFNSYSSPSSAKPLRKAQSPKEVESQVGSLWKNSDQLIKTEGQETGDTGLAPFVEYLSQANGFLYCAASVLVVSIFLAGQVSSNLWMAVQVGNPRITMAHLVGVYAAISLSSGGVVALRSVTSFFMGMKTSKVLYSRFMNSVFGSSMSFFDSTPLGRILSRLSSDLQILDNDVPMDFGFTISSTMNTLTTLAVTSVMTWQTLILIIPIIFCTRWLQRYYLSSARQLMRINATAKSPLVNHFGECMAGAMTIRAYGRENEFKTENHQRVDTNSSSFFYSISATEWLVQRLDMLCTSLLCSCSLVMVLLPKETIEPGVAGLIMTYGLSLNFIMIFSVTQQCTLANDIISMERLKLYMYNEPEAPLVIQSSRPPENWPAQGRIEFNNLHTLILKGITCTFEGGHTIGVVGRTGSGKTTLINSLFRLVEPTDGNIHVDGIDISKIGLQDLRSKFSIIPQEPALFRGTIRFNIDPLGEYADEDIWSVVEKCQLGDVIRSKDQKLDYQVTDDGENWSVGQRQLFCLGRVLLRRSRVLVLDEATASIDTSTVAVPQKVIREEFRESTVITVAHRIPSVIDSDMVLTLSDGMLEMPHPFLNQVLSCKFNWKGKDYHTLMISLAGLLMEYDKPAKLLQDPSSWFAKLVAQYRSQTQQRADEFANDGKFTILSGYEEQGPLEGIRDCELREARDADMGYKQIVTL